jgi:hypothetical protein
MHVNLETGKYVIVIDGSLPLGLMLNTAALLGVTMGARLDDLLGMDAMDGSQQNHVGLMQMTLPILKTTSLMLSKIKEAAALEPEILVIDFSEQAQMAKTRDEYLESIRNVPSAEIRYLGLALCGDKRKVNSITGSLPLVK